MELTVENRAAGHDRPVRRAAALCRARPADRPRAAAGDPSRSRRPGTEPTAPAAPRPRPVAAEPSGFAFEQGAASGIRAIIAADPDFDVARFLEGAQAAYRMVLEAFWKGDREELAYLTGDEVRDGVRGRRSPSARPPATSSTTGWSRSSAPRSRMRGSTAASPRSTSASTPSSPPSPATPRASWSPAR